MLSISRNNRENIGKHSEIISNIKLFIDKCNWKGTNYPSEKDDWNKFEKNNLTI